MLYSTQRSQALCEKMLGLYIQVPYDPDLPFLFFGEEMSMLARMWTNGWDVMAPTQVQTQYICTRDHPHAHSAD